MDFQKIRVKVVIEKNKPTTILRADGDYSKKDYTDLRYMIFDLNEWDISLEIEKGMKPSEIIKKYNGQFGGNCCFAWLNRNTYFPIGNIVKDEKYIQQTPAKEKWGDFIVPISGKPYIGQLTNSKGVKLSFSSTPIIVKDGKWINDIVYESTPNDILARNPRTAIGISKDGNKLIYCVVDGRSKTDTGVTLYELSQIMISLGAFEVLNLDGGGSCSLVHNGQIQNYQAKQGERATSNAIIFKKKVKQPSPPPTPPTIKPTGKKVYLSPSTQEHNIGVGNYGTEESRMHQVAEVVRQILINHGVEVKIGKVEQTLQQMVAESNSFKPNVHFAIHSDADSNGKSRGSTGFACSQNGNKLMQCVYKYVSDITPIDDRGIKDGSHLYEVKNTNAVAGLIETSFHTNLNDVNWILSHINNIGEAIAKGILEYLGIQY